MSVGLIRVHAHVMVIQNTFSCSRQGHQEGDDQSNNAKYNAASCMSCDHVQKDAEGKDMAGHEEDQ